ncbi:MAG: hypothetical protein ACLTYW_06485 [Collinsella sp.]
MTDQETPERAHVTADDIEAANDLIDFIEACPSMFHTAATIMAELDEAGFTYLPENAAWDIEPGGRYYTQRNTSSVVALRWARTWPRRGARTVLPVTIIFSSRRRTAIRRRLRSRPCPSSTGGRDAALNTEAYGGMIDYTWFDRPLALAGRVLVREGDRMRAACLPPSARSLSFRALPST